MNLSKHLEFLNPKKIESEIHLIGCGALGSHIAVLLTRLGFTDIHLYDFDTVEEHNIANQTYFEEDIGLPKVTALAHTMQKINKRACPILHKNGWSDDQDLLGYVFIATDNIEVRKQIVNHCIGKKYVKGIFDFRMRLIDAQHFAAEYDPSFQNYKNLLKSMDFTQEEADKATPISACGTTLSVITTINTITSLGVSNFINLINEKPLMKLILIDAFNFTIDAI